MRVKLACLFLVIAFLQVSFASNAQNITLTKKNISLIELFREIKRQTGYDFVYNHDLLLKGSKVHIDVKNGQLKDVLDASFKNQPFAYAIESGTVVVSPKTNELQQSVAAQDELRGKVIDASGRPVVGATVREVGTEKRTLSDRNGDFLLTGIRGNARLQVTFIGYEPTEVDVNSRQTLTIVLKEYESSIDEVVVVGYGTQKKELVTSAIGSFKVQDEDIRQVASPTRLLEGRIAGVNVSMGSGNLASEERISIRGTSSISAGNNPLYVVDGVPINTSGMSTYNFGESYSPLAAFNHADIESIEILKDAASAAIYGSRASNGVVIITTKSGKAGRSDVRLNITGGFSNFLNRDKIRLANSDEYIAVYNAGADNYNRQYGRTIGHADYKIKIQNPYAGLPDTDWLGLVSQTGYFQNYDASFGGGNAKTNYYFGLGLTDQEGVMKQNAIRKYNLNTKVSHKFNDWLEVGANNMANYIRNNQVPGADLGTTIIGRAIEQRPFDRPFKPNGDYYVGGTDELTRHNPVQILNEQVAYVDNYRYLGTYYGQAQFLDNFSFRSSFSADIGYTYDYTYYNQNHPYGTGVGRLIDHNRLIQNLVFDNVLNYDNTFGDLTLNAMIGHSFQKQSTRNSSIDGRGFPTPSMRVISVASEIYEAGGSIGEYALESYFGRGTLSYQDKYMMTATLRADGSSKFHRNNRWGYFPSISFGWNLSKEEFVGENDNDIKIRASYGQTGNQEGIGQYAYQALMAGGQNYGNQSGIAVSTFGNEDLRWEKANQFDVGFDISFFERKLNVSFDAYHKKTYDLLYSMPIHATTGVTSIVSNIGSMLNKGVEFSINADTRLGNVGWNSAFNIAHNTNKITSLLEDDAPISIGGNRALQVGKSIGAFFLFDSDGLYQYDGEVPQEQYDLGVRAGDVKWVDVDGNNIINDSDRVVKGASNPKFTGGWNNSFNYRGFQLDVMFTFMYGSDVYAQWKSTGMANLAATFAKDITYIENAWTGPGSTNVYPRPLIGHSHNNRNSTRFLEDGSFIRLRALTLGYNFSPDMLRSVKLKGLRLFATADNLFLLTNYAGWDPEVNNNLDPRFYGVDLFGVPQPRTFSFGANINL